MIKKNIIFLILLSIMVTLSAVQVKKVGARKYHDFQKGDLKGTSIDSRGRLFLGPEKKSIKGPKKEYYLSLELARNGDIYIGTGHKSSVFKIQPATGKIEEVFASSQLDIYALVVNSKNEIYAGSSPNGKIYKISKDKKVTDFFDPSEKFIWDMKEDHSGNIICAVGNSGGIYKIKPSGDASKIFTPEDAHIISLYIGKNNSILAGSGDRGILYRIDNRKVKVLYDSPLEEIRGICEDSEGNIYFSATKGVYKYRTSTSTNIELVFGDKDKKTRKYSTQKSILYCYHTNGIVEEVWSSNEDYVYSICYDEINKSIVVGTGNSGRIFRIDKDGHFSLVFESDSAQIYKVIRGQSGFTFITNNTASISTLQNNLNRRGTYLSEIYDVEVQSRFGKLYWDASKMNNTNVLFFIRAGNSVIPDKTWSDWSPPFTDSDNSPLNVSGYRYFQIRVILNLLADGKTPYVHNYKVFCIQSNLKPQFKGVEIVKPNLKISKTKTEKKEEKNSKYLIVRWEVRDPNKDELKYSIFIKKVGDKNWIPIKKNITKKRILLQTELFEDGEYLLKVIADDSLFNPPSTSLSSSFISKPFVIDSTAPVLKNLAIKGNRISFNVLDQTSLISQVLYSFDGELWSPVFPDDMINDSNTENYYFTLNSVKNKKIIFIKIIDEFYNQKVFQKEL